MCGEEIYWRIPSKQSFPHYQLSSVDVFHKNPTSCSSQEEQLSSWLFSWQIIDNTQGNVFLKHWLGLRGQVARVPSQVAFLRDFFFFLKETKPYKNKVNNSIKQYDSQGRPRWKYDSFARTGLSPPGNWISLYLALHISVFRIRILKSIFLWSQSWVHLTKGKVDFWDPQELLGLKRYS